jgi:hypothetical protein
MLPFIRSPLVTLFHRRFNANPSRSVRFEPGNRSGGHLEIAL